MKDGKQNVIFTFSCRDTFLVEDQIEVHEEITKLAMK